MYDAGNRGIQLDDGELITRAKDGDADAFGALVQRYQAVALRVAYPLTAADADDVVQEAFVKAYRQLHRFRDDKPFRPWLLKIVANEARNSRRSAGRRHHLAIRAGHVAGASPPPLPEELAVDRDRSRSLAAALSTLSDDDRLVLAYRWFAGMTEAEMADALGCRPGTVKSRLSRAHARLRVALGG